MNNKDYTFFIFTDQRIKYKSDNIVINYITLADVNLKLSRLLGLKCSVTKPYKLCDIKPFYGMLFSDYIHDFDYWGHCDIDMIFGDLAKFVNDDIIRKYDKINICGHFVLYKNTKLNNEMFRKRGAIYDYRTVVTSEENYAFDEYSGMNMIYKINNVDVLLINDYIDVDERHKRFLANNNVNYKKQIFVYENKKLYQYYIEKGRLKNKEIMYIHFQKKNPKVYTDNYSAFIISSEGFSEILSDYALAVSRLNRYHGFLFELFESCSFYFRRFVSLLRMTPGQRRVKLKQLKLRVKHE